MQERTRRRSGTMMTETGPALFILFIVIFFPMLDLMGLACSYGMCWYLNYSISNEIARSRKAEGPEIVSRSVTALTQSGFGQFLGIKSGSVNIPAPVYNDTANPPTVVVTTSMAVKPFITVPWFRPVPGLNAPITYTVTSQLTRELPI